MSDVLAGRAATFSKGPEFWSGAPDWQPQELLVGRGAHVHAADNRRYLDWVSGLGANLLGYPSGILDNPHRLAADHWADVVSQQVFEGVGFSLPHILEGHVAERLAQMLGSYVPGWRDQPLGLRFLLSGSDACMAAVRLARAVTNREWVISVGYHGWHDTFVSTTDPAWGVIRPHVVKAKTFGYANLIDQCLYDQDRLGDRVAALIIEQPPQVAPVGYWQDVRRFCTEYGALLILDEVVTGLRFGLGGAAEHLGIEPDIVCMGKALGNGIPLSCIVGRREYFDWFSRNDPVFVSSTHFGNAISLAACNAVLEVWDQDCVDHVWRIGRELMDGLEDVGFGVAGYPPVFLVDHQTPSHRAYFVRGMAERNILANRPFIPNLAHTAADVVQTVAAAREIKAEMDRVDVVAEMAGKLPQVLFERR